MGLEYEPSSKLLHISVKYLFRSRERYRTVSSAAYPPALGDCANYGLELEPFYLVSTSNTKRWQKLTVSLRAKSTFGIFYLSSAQFVPHPRASSLD